MFRCETHGVVPCVFCCFHVAEALDGGRPLEVDYVFDDFGQSFLICADCLVAVREYVSMQAVGRVEACPFEITGECSCHVQDWMSAVNGVALDELFDAAERRTGRRPVR